MRRNIIYETGSLVNVVRWALRAALCEICLFALESILVGCTDTNTKDEFKVAMLLPGDITDAGWNTLAYEGLMEIEKELGAKIEYVVSRTPADQELHFRFYAEREFDLIFGHGL